MQSTRTRTKSGCLTCRLRRKKCDERKPTCYNCEASQRTCKWPSFRVIELSSASKAGLVQQQKAARSQEAPPTLTYARNITESAFPLDFSPNAEPHIYRPISPVGQRFHSTSQDLSWRLVEYFLTEGSRGMSSREPSNDPFLRLVIQLAQTDRLIWSAMLAFSGCRMLAACDLPIFERVTMNHYNDTLLQLQVALTDWHPSSGEGMLSLLTAAILLCQEEAFQGNKRNSLQSHLRAAREMVNIARTHPSAQQYSEVYSVLFEAYTYFSNMYTFQPAASELDIQANLESLQFYRSLPSHSTFGYIMVAACDLFTLIPCVAMFGLSVRNRGNPDQRCLDLDLLYHRLAAKILSWKTEPSAQKLPEVAVRVSMIYQNALLAFLHASYLCRQEDRSALKALLKPIVADTLLISESIKNTPAFFTAFWPMVIVGSCMYEQRDQELLLTYVNQRRTTFGIQGRACEALSWVWQHRDQDAFGPTGLEQFTKANGTGLCIG